MKNHYELVKIKPQGSVPLFIFLIIDIVLWSMQLYALGAVASVLTIVISIQPSGFIFDKENNRVKIVKGYLSLRSGKWKKLPEIKYVSLLRVKHIDNLHQTNPTLYSPKTTRSSNYMVNLIIKETWQRERPVRLMKTSKETAITEGLKLAEYLDLRVLDQTTHEKHWIR